MSSSPAPTSLPARGHRPGDGIRLLIELARVAVTAGLARHLRPRALLAALRARRAGAHTFGMRLALYAASQPTRPALISRRGVLTFAELERDYHRASHVLLQMGVSPGDRLVVMMGNCAEFLVLSMAAANVGATLTPVSVGLTARELGQILDDARPRAVLTDGARFGVVQSCLEGRPALEIQALVVEAGQHRVPLDYAQAVAAAPATPIPPVEGRSRLPRIMLYTSGTTGRAKGVEQTERSVSVASVRALLGLLAGFGVSTRDVFYTPCPLYHSGPFFLISLHMALGATIVVGDDTRPEAILDALARHAVTDAFLVPTLLTRLSQHEPAPPHLPHLRAIYSSAARLPVVVAQEILKRFGPVLYDFYGATEFGIATLATPADLAQKPGTIGRALPGTEVHLVGTDGQEVASGGEGELYVWTPLLMRGYRGDDASTRAGTWRGCFSVGDVALRDDDGHVFIVGRRKDMINTGGVKVFPAEVEEVLHGHPAVADVAVVGVEHPEWGESVVAVVVPRSGPPDEASLRSFAAERLARPKQPKRYLFWPELPVSPQGKVLKRAIIEQISALPPS